MAQLPLATNVLFMTIMATGVTQDEPVDGNPAHSSVSIVRGTLAS